MGLPAESVTAFEGHLLEDGYAVGSDTVRYRLKVERVRDRNGWETEASGEIVLYSNDQHPRQWGARLLVNAPLKSTVYNGRNLYACQTGEENVRQTGWIAPLFSIREQLRRSILHRTGGIGKDSGPLMEALLLGVRDDLTLFEISLFRKAGCMHILALSGMHLGILAGVLYLVLRLVLPRPSVSVIVVATLVAYLFLAGFKPSLVRGVIMVVLMWVGSLSGRVNQGITILLGAFIIQSLLFPASADSLSFQLSFLALGGILLFSVPLARRTAGLLPRWVSFPLASAVGAQCLTGGLVLVRFQALYPIGIAASLLLTPLITLFMWLGLLCLLLPDLLPLQFYLHRAADMVYHCIVHTASWFARMPAIELGDPVPVTLYWMILALVLVTPLVPGKRSG